MADRIQDLRSRLLVAVREVSSFHRRHLLRDTWFERHDAELQVYEALVAPGGLFTKYANQVQLEVLASMVDRVACTIARRFAWMEEADRASCGRVLLILDPELDTQLDELDASLEACQCGLDTCLACNPGGYGGELEVGSG